MKYLSLYTHWTQHSKHVALSSELCDQLKGNGMRWESETSNRLCAREHKAQEAIECNWFHFVARFYFQQTIPLRCSIRNVHALARASFARWIEKKMKRNCVLEGESLSRIRIHCQSVCVCVFVWVMVFHLHSNPNSFSYIRCDRWSSRCSTAFLFSSFTMYGNIKYKYSNAHADMHTFS